MQYSYILKTSVRLNVVLAATLCLFAQEQPVRPKEALGLAPRAAPTDYQNQIRVGTITIAADFVRHSVPTTEATLSTEDYVVVETGLYGPPDARMRISVDDFSLRINGKKTPLQSQPFGLVLKSLKDPEWAPPDSGKSKSKTNIGGSGEDSSSPPPVVHVPIELQRAMAQHTQEASLPQGSRALPVAGLLFFPYRGKEKGIYSVELIYTGPTGKATLPLHP